MQPNSKAYVAVSIPRPTPTLLNSMLRIKKIGYEPIPIFRGGLESIINKAGVNPSIGIAIRDFKCPDDAAKYLVDETRRRNLVFQNWVNLSDDTTELFLLACPTLVPSLDFSPYGRCRIKPVARKLLYEANVVENPGYVVSISDRIPEFLMNRYSQIVAKPIMGAGSELVCLITSQDDWYTYQHIWKESVQSYPVNKSTFLGYLPFKDVLLEPMFKGIEIRADGYVYNGEAIICAMAERVTEITSSGFREIGGVAYAPSSFPYESVKFEMWIKHVLHALDYCNGVFHLEAIRLSPGRYELIEVNPRVGGGGCSLVTRGVSGVDLAEENIGLWLGRPISINNHEANSKAVIYSVMYHGDDGVVRDIKPGNEFMICNEQMAQWIPFVSVNDSVHGKKSEHYLGELHEHYKTNESLKGIPKDQALRQTIKKRLQWMDKMNLVVIN